MKIKTSELSGAALDWAVAKAADIPVGVMSGILYRKDLPGDTYGPGPIFNPSADWSQGGPLIENLEISIVKEFGRKVYACSEIEVGNCWHVSGDQSGDTYLIAAMRAIVAAKLGEEIEVPEELV